LTTSLYSFISLAGCLEMGKLEEKDEMAALYEDFFDDYRKCKFANIDFFI
jgi:hypothetical protein